MVRRFWPCMCFLTWMFLLRFCFEFVDRRQTTIDMQISSGIVSLRNQKRSAIGDDSLATKTISGKSSSPPVKHAEKGVEFELQPQTTSTKSQRATTVMSHDECPIELGNFASMTAMSAAGWRINIEEMFFGASFVGWTGGTGVGSLTTEFTTSGMAILIFANDHEDGSPSNVVKVELNGKLFGKAGQQEEHLLCLRFDKGDKLSISEVYGKIRLKSFTVDCSKRAGENTLENSARPPVATSSCADDRQEWTAAYSFGCSLKPNTYHGLVELALSKTQFLVQVHGLVPKEGVRRVASVPQDADVPSPGSIVRAEVSHCATTPPKSTGVVVLADAQHAESYKEQIQSLYCYTAAHGYDMWHLNVRAFDKCERFRKQYFFMKHCVVSEFLALRPPDYTAVVVDGDVVAAVMERGLEQWTSSDADVQLYHRAAATEIAAGNYIVRNTPWARQWLMGWAERMYHIPKGYSSADNGALHLHVIETLQLKGAEICAEKYAKLVALVDNLKPYFNFVNCALGLLGRPRKWRVGGGASLIIWPKVHFFVADGIYLTNRGSNTGGPVFHHGYKARAWEPKAVHKTYFRDLPSCKLDVKRLTSHKELGLAARGLVPEEMKSCVLEFACKPLEYDDPPKRDRTCGKCE
eukprot:TRINITY_DN62844_c0_g1_i1.p1 TRINITY_DN62844_c0_g1~~TRINITY_DN62844_c0_g1_i1.p1  ORF type:complete len:636 (+),score=73.82 TRINITY_DN62844_c0_g1_i1:93-2000(+)